MKAKAMGALPPEKVDALIAKMAASPLGISAAAPEDPQYVWSGKEIPKGASLQEFCTPVEDQLQWGTCTANTSVGACELFLKRAGQFIATTSDLSRTFNYWWAGVLDNMAGQDVGRTVRNALRAAKLYGMCLESTAPYIDTGVTQPPSPAANAEAMHHKLGKFSVLMQYASHGPDTTLLRIKQAINDGFPVSMAFGVKQWLFDVSGPLATHAALPGKMKANDPRNTDVGNHDVLVVGFQDTSNASGGYLLVRNSWGTEWGDGGYWAMPYTMLDAAYEFWAVEEFNGLDAALVEPPLANAEVEAARQRLLAKGLAHVGSSGHYAFGPIGMEAYGAAAIALLQHEGKSVTQIAQVGAIERSALEDFMAQPANEAMIAAWQAALK